MQALTDFFREYALNNEGKKLSVSDVRIDVEDVEGCSRVHLAYLTDTPKEDLLKNSDTHVAVLCLIALNILDASSWVEGLEE